MTDELTRLSTARAAELIRRREVSPVELVVAYLRRVQELNPRLNAVVTLAPDALEVARRAEDALMRGDIFGPLHGVPMTVKDTINVKGLRATAGSLLREGFVPEEDAPAVARLRAAGAVIIGKTNTSELALDYSADNPIFGRTNNPHDESRTPGGSSGGCAAAVCAGLTAASLGSDLSGSVRIPAHFCGVVSLRGTSARVPTAGHLPPTGGVFALGASLGPLARHVEDLELLFGALSDDASIIKRVSETSRERQDLRGLRFAVYTEDGVAPVDEETKRAVERAADALEAAGLVGVNEAPPGVEQGHELWLALFSRATQQFLQTMYAGREHEGGPVVRAVLKRAASTPPPSPEAFSDARARRDELRDTLLEWMKETPLLVAPVGACAAPPHGAIKVSVGTTQLNLFRAFSYAQTFNTFDLPAACVPAGRTTEGLPVGVQIAGLPNAEGLVLEAARVVEEALGGWKEPAALSASS